MSGVYQKISHSIILKTLLLLVILQLLINDISFALAPAPGTQNPAVRCEFRVQSLLQSGHLKFTDTDADRELLRQSNKQVTLLVSSGNILASDKLRQDPQALIRNIISEELRAILSIMRREEPDRYDRITKLVMSDNGLPARYGRLIAKVPGAATSGDPTADDILTYAFELILLRDNGLMEESDISSDEREFLHAIEPIIYENRDWCFTGVFWDDSVREAKIRVAMANEADRASQGSSSASDPSKESIQSQKPIAEDERIRRDSLVNLISFFDAARSLESEIQKALAMYSLASAFEEAGLKEGAVKLLEKALHFARDIDDDTKQSSTLWNIVDSLIRLGILKKDRKLLEEALNIARGFEDEMTSGLVLAKVAYSFGEIGRRQEAISIIDEARRLASSINNEPLRTRYLSRVATYLCQIGAVTGEPALVDQGLDIIRGSADKRLKVSSFSEIAVSLNKLNLKDRAREIVQEGISAAMGASESNFPKDIVLRDIASDLAKISAMDKDLSGIRQVLEIARGMGDQTCKVKLILSAARFLDKADMNTEAKEAALEALKVAKAIGNQSHQEEMLSLIAPSLVWIGTRQNDGALAEKGFQVAGSITRELIRAGTIAEVASALAELGVLEKRIELIYEARGMARGITDSSKRPQCLSIVACCLAQIGAITKNQKLLQHAIVVAEHIDGKIPKDDAFSKIASSLAEIGAKEKDRRLMEEALRVAKDYLSENRRIATLTKIAPFLIRGGIVAEKVRQNEDEIVDFVKQNLDKNGDLEEPDRHLLVAIGMFSDKTIISSYLSDEKIPAIMKAFLVWGENFITAKPGSATILKDLYLKERAGPDNGSDRSLRTQRAISKALNFLFNEYKDEESFICLEDIGLLPNLGYRGCKRDTVGVMPIGNLTLGFIPHMEISMIFESLVSRHFGRGDSLKIRGRAGENVRDRGGLGALFLTKRNYGSDIFAQCYRDTLPEVIIVAPRNKKLVSMVGEIFELISALYKAKGSPVFSTSDLDGEGLRNELRKDFNDDKAVLQKLGLNKKTIKTVSTDELVKALNNLLMMRDFHASVDSNVYRIDFKNEMKHILSRAQRNDKTLTDMDYMRLNRALLEVMYPNYILRKAEAGYLESPEDVERNLPIFILASNGIFYDEVMFQFELKFHALLKEDVYEAVKRRIVRGPTTHNGTRKGRGKDSIYEPGAKGGITIAAEDKDIVDRIEEVFRARKYKVEEKFKGLWQHPLPVEYSKGLLNLYFNVTGLLFIVGEGEKLQRPKMGDVLSNADMKRRAQEILKVAVALGIKNDMYKKGKGFEEALAEEQKRLDGAAKTFEGHVTSSVSEIVSVADEGSDSSRLVAPYDPSALTDGITDLDCNLLDYFIGLAGKYKMSEEWRFLTELKRELAGKIVKAKQIYDAEKIGPSPAAGKTALPEKLKLVVPEGLSKEWSDWLGALEDFGKADIAEITRAMSLLEKKVAEHSVTGQSIILYADDILEHAGIYDLDHTVKNILRKHNVLSGGKIVLFSRDGSDAEILRRIIANAAPEIGVLSISEADIGNISGPAREVDAIARCARAKGVKDIMAIIKGHSGNEDEKALREVARELKSPIVLIGPEKALYSFSQALFLALASKVSNGAEYGWLIMLPSARSVTEEVRALYDAYKRTLAALRAA